MKVVITLGPDFQPSSYYEVSNKAFFVEFSIDF